MPDDFWRYVDCQASYVGATVSVPAGLVRRRRGFTRRILFQELACSAVPFTRQLRMASLRSITHLKGADRWIPPQAGFARWRHW